MYTELIVLIVSFVTYKYNMPSLKSFGMVLAWFARHWQVNFLVFLKNLWDILKRASIEFLNDLSDLSSCSRGLYFQSDTYFANDWT